MEIAIDKVIRIILELMQKETELSEEEKQAALKKIGNILAEEGVLDDQE